MIDIRTADDWRDLRAVRLRALWESPDAFGRTWAQDAKLPPEQWAVHATTAFLAWGGPALIGMSRYWLQPKLNRGLVVGMWVAPEWRGSSTATGLLTAARDEIRHAGLQPMLWCNADNRRAMNFYHREGFIETGRRIERRLGLEVELVYRYDGL